MKKQFLTAVTLSLWCGLMIACSKENEQNLAGPVVTVPVCDTANMKLSTNIKPVLTANCYNCHGNGASQGGVKLDVYTDLKLWATSGSLLGAVAHASGYSPMPKNAAKLSDCDINKIKAWIDRGALNN